MSKSSSSTSARTTEIREGRTLVLCFDGTTNQYSNMNTNVVQLFSLLKKDDFNEQLCYYQPGVGTGFEPGVVSPLFDWAAKILDMAIAWYLDQHVMNGYKFLMNNYRVGDKICLFGFSRGAYTARALAGLLSKIGLLPRDNDEQIPFAYKLYKKTDKGSVTLASGFKKTYCQDVRVEFVGVWDTVASVGIVAGRNLPFTNSNSDIKTFRHALALDEHRVKFFPNAYHHSVDSEREAERDPEHGSPVVGRDNDTPGSGGQPLPTNVLEVWFVGCHSDVGGGSVPNTDLTDLSNITLRWMVRQAIEAQCGILFDQSAMKDLKISSPISTAFVVKNGNEDGNGRADTEREKDMVDAKEPIHDSLKTHPIWWILELVPLKHTWQDMNGRWHRWFGANFGRGRDLTKTNDVLKFHETVKARIEDGKLKYKPRAKYDHGCVQYVF